MQEINPFSVNKSDIKKTKFDVVIQEFNNSLFLFINNKKRTVKSILKEYKTTCYVREFKSYYLKTEDVKPLVLCLRDRKVSFGILEDVSLKLQTSKLNREKVFSASYSDTELLNSSLELIISKKNGKYYFVNTPLFLFKKINNSKLLKKDLNALNQGFDLKYLISFINICYDQGVNIFFSNDVKKDLLEYSNKINDLIYKKPNSFNQEFLYFSNLQNGFIIRNNKAEFIFEDSKEMIDLLSSVISKNTKLYNDKLNLKYKTLQIPDYLLVDVYNEIISIVKKLIPKSDIFNQRLLKLSKVNKEININKKIQNLPNIELDLKYTKHLNQLFDHQKVAISWLLERTSGLLADEMGLGKTFSIIALYTELFLNSEIDFILVISPNSLVRNWKKEFDTWYPENEIVESVKSKAKQDNLLQNFCYKGLIINYESFRVERIYKQIFKILENKKVLLVLDESQRIKNPSSKTFKSIKKLSKKVKRTYLLSGTPVTRNISDLWSQIYMLDQGKSLGANYQEWLKSSANVSRRYNKAIIHSFSKEATENIIYFLNAFLLKRTKDQVLSLPEKIYSTIDLEMKGDQLNRYEELCSDLRIRITKMNGREYHKNISSILEEYLRAVQIASNPRLIDPLFKEDSVKFKQLDSLIDEIVIYNKSKVIIWTSFRKNVEELLERYSKYKPLSIIGNQTTDQRGEIVAKFQNETENKVLIAIPSAGGVGLTLTAANYSIYLDKTWNAEHWMQSVDRIHRIGQTGTVNIISLNACKIDLLICKNIEKKSKLLERALNLGTQLEPDNFLPSKDELLDALY